MKKYEKPIVNTDFEVNRAKKGRFLIVQNSNFQIVMFFHNLMKKRAEKEYEKIAQS